MDIIKQLFSGFTSNLGFWWDALALDFQVFYIVGIISTFLIVVQATLMVFGFDETFGAPDDVDFASSSDAGVLSVKTVSAFFAGFGWTGVICLRNGLTLGPAIGMGLVVGGGFMVVVLSMMKFMYGLRSSGNVRFENAIGKSARVYIAIPGAQQGKGQVEIKIQGQLRFVDAYTDAPERISSNARVTVKEVIDTATLLVEPIQPNNNEE